MVAADNRCAVQSASIKCLISLTCVGLASGTIDSLGAGFITAIRDVGSSGLVHGAYGVGATLGPLIVVAVSSRRLALGISGAIVIAAALVALRSQQDWPGIVPHVRKTGSRLPFAPAALSLGAFGAFVGMEVTTGKWAFTQLTEGRHAGDALAAVAVALFWGGLAIGRLVLIRPSVREMADRVGLSRLALVSLCCVASLAFVPPGLAVVGPGVCGADAGAHRANTLCIHSDPSGSRRRPATRCLAAARHQYRRNRVAVPDRSTRRRDGTVGDHHCHRCRRRNRCSAAWRHRAASGTYQRRPVTRDSIAVMSIELPNEVATALLQSVWNATRIPTAERSVRISVASPRSNARS